MLIAAIAAALVVLNDAGKSANDPLTVDVFSKQYFWSFGYPGKDNAFSARELHVPLGRPIQFKMYSQDVDHFFWVPKWRVKVANLPNVTATATVTPDKIGTYQLICAQLCGIEHAYMRAKVVVEPPDEFRKWVDGLGKTVPASYLETIHLNSELKAIRQGTEAGQ